MSDNKVILGPDGRPIIDTIGLAVLKIPRGSPQPTPQLLQVVSQVTHCNVVVLPPEYELATGRLATETITRIHTLCHQLEAWREEKGKPYDGQPGN